MRLNERWWTFLPLFIESNVIPFHRFFLVQKNHFAILTTALNSCTNDERSLKNRIFYSFTIANMKCPFCSEEIKDDAKKCRFCGEFLEEKQTKKDFEVKEYWEWFTNLWIVLWIITIPFYIWIIILIVWILEKTKKLTLWKDSVTIKEIISSHDVPYKKINSVSSTWSTIYIKTWNDEKFQFTLSKKDFDEAFPLLKERIW